MKQKNILFPFFFLLFFCVEVMLAQDCKVTIENQKVFSKYPESKKEFERFNHYTKKVVSKKQISQSNRAGETYIIPVVVHVYGATQHGLTVTYDKIKVALDKLNEDFNGLNDDFNTVDPVFSGRRGTLSIRFALAKIDPNGGSTNGVVFHPEKAGYGNGGGYDAQIAADAWDNYKYMNVYIMGDLYADGSSTNSGVAWYPNTAMSNNNTARVVYNGRYIHGNTNKEFASVLTHEFGHWLNLIHTFEGGCNDPNGDYVDDTPKEDTNSGDDGCNVGASDCGNLINYENYMGYDSASGCAKMFTQGQINRMLVALDHPARKPLWQPSNLVATGVNLSGGSLVVDNNKVEEALTNNGTIVNEAKHITLEGGTFAVGSGNLSLGTHFDLNLPQGISAQISVVNNRKLSVNFTGKALNHVKANNSTGIITFKDAAISGGTTALNSNKVAFEFSFYDPYKIVYVDNQDYTANSGSTWTFFRIEGAENDNAFGTFFENNALKLETYQKALVCQPGTRNPIPLTLNTEINQQSSWVSGGAYPDLHVIRDVNYTAWDGKTAYIGFQFQLYPGKLNYGWFRVQVNNNGSSYSLLDYAYSTEPYGEIKAGSKVYGGQPTCNDGVQNGDETGVDCGGTCEPCNVAITYCDSNGKNANDEFISRVQLHTIDNSSSSSSNGYADYTASISTNLLRGDSYSVTITPSWRTTKYSEGYSVWIDYNKNGDFTDPGELVWSKSASKDNIVSGQFTVPNSAVLGDTRMRVSMKYNGIATSCESFSYGEVEDYKIIISENSLPTCNDGVQNGDETGVDCGGSCLPCDTTDNIVYVDIDDLTVRSNDTWKFFRIESGDDTDYGAWYTGNTLRLVTYGKELVCNGVSNEVSYLEEGVVIGSSSNFVTDSHSFLVSSSDYTLWNGKTGFIGFSFKINGNTHYGWFHVSVASNGQSYTLTDYAYNKAANLPITTVNRIGAVGARYNELSKNVTLYAAPNPFESQTKINLSGFSKKEDIQLHVYDLLGRHIYTEKVNSSSTYVVIDESILKKEGMYLLKIQSGEEIKTLSILKK
ncbi:GEVED domain-containing protein [Tenacibaculum sp. Mcav3-52]|uniref:M43 family zinc metalloprotease n=1 Tax=unclassified Tenacibaculum TaxID=2635139 RepID=UPI001EF2AA43|nr:MULTISPECIES: M43 family zinc metalloprotease [unclassified Tenacibaculum]MCG7500577.1 GEVED domain-containing protein [Tenacibaculum sp. Mcav3-52]MCO7184376.1 M43 family zinc metalloprotease [Tenacibaculum sp. XPcli2-G]